MSDAAGPPAGRPPFEHLGSAETTAGELILWRRWDPVAGVEITEVKLGEEYLMSSLFTAAEVELATLGLASVEGDQLDVLVGGLGLGFTARAVLDDPRVRSLVIVELYEAVVLWHRDDLVRGGADLLGDARCRVVVGDFFALVEDGALADQPAAFDAVLVDIDHAPDRLLRTEHADFYREPGLRSAAGLLAPGGCFGLWSDDPPDEGFLTRLGEVFGRTQAEVVPFSSPYHQVEATNTVYLSGDPLPAGRGPGGP